MSETLLLFVLGFFALMLLAFAATAVSLLKRLKQVERTARHDGFNLRHELNTRLQSVEKKVYEALPGTEVLVYDGRLLESDFRGQGSQAWDYVAHRFADGTGTGSHQVQDSMLTIQRTNNVGRYELTLQRFLFEGRETDRIPATALKPMRHIRLSFEVRRHTSSHLLRFVFKGETSKEVLDEKDYVAFNPEWEKVDLFFTVSTAEDCVFRIDDLGVATAPSDIHLRNLLVKEKG